MEPTEPVCYICRRPVNPPEDEILFTATRGAIHGPDHTPYSFDRAQYFMTIIRQSTLG